MANQARAANRPLPRVGWILLPLIALSVSCGSGPDAKAARDARILKARTELRALAERVEAFRTQTGRLPNSLEEAATGLPTSDLAADRPLPGEALPYFYENLSDNRGYYLFSRGPDGSSFTPDDLYPLVSEAEQTAWAFQKPPSDRNTLVAAKGAEDLNTLRWRDPDEGLAEAKKAGKPVLMDFTAEWCGWCHKLERDVFDQPEVTVFINRHYVPIRVMDRRSETGSNTKTVADLQAKFGLRGFPMLVVADADLKRSSVQNGYVPLEGSFAFLKAFVKP